MRPRLNVTPMAEPITDTDLTRLKSMCLKAGSGDNQDVGVLAMASVRMVPGVIERLRLVEQELRDARQSAEAYRRQRNRQKEIAERAEERAQNAEKAMILWQGKWSTAHSEISRLQHGGSTS